MFKLFSAARIILSVLEGEDQIVTFALAHASRMKSECLGFKTRFSYGEVLTGSAPEDEPSLVKCHFWKFPYSVLQS